MGCIETIESYGKAIDFLSFSMRSVRRFRAFAIYVAIASPGESPIPIRANIDRTMSSPPPCDNTKNVMKSLV